mmetsp:Transcript_14224/g.21502  ORF Transcript_14224/g.21502 Transcript_14224/m.21502 type:complete len:238 (-) Transcript_14224:2692-3405(-)
MVETYSLNTHRGHVLIKYKENLLFLLDTGCPITLLSRQLLTSDIVIGGINLKNEANDLTILGDINKLLGIKIDGLIGMNVLRKYENVIINYKDAIIELNTENKTIEERYKKKSTIIPYTPTHSGLLPIMKVKFKDIGEKKVYFDTGAFLSYVNFEFDLKKTRRTKDFHPSVGEFDIDLYATYIQDFLSDTWNELEIGTNDVVKGILKQVDCDAVIGTQCLLTKDFILYPKGFQFAIR